MDDKVFNLLEKMYGELTGKIDGLSNEIKEVKSEVKDIKKQLVTMEHDNNEHFKALYDGYKQSIEGINAIREEVAKHE